MARVLGRAEGEASLSLTDKASRPVVSEHSVNVPYAITVFLSLSD